MIRFFNGPHFPFWLYWRLFNLWPALRGTGLRVTYVARDWTELRLKLKLSWRTRNYVGTIFGGSMYGAADPFYMVMIIRQIGDDYVVWDKSARIEFRRPGDRTLYATFRVPQAEVASLRAAADADGELQRDYAVELVDSDGKVYAVVTKTIYVARKDWFKRKRAERSVQRQVPR